jgi:hypothetical protein
MFVLALCGLRPTYLDGHHGLQRRILEFHARLPLHDVHEELLDLFEHVRLAHAREANQ